MAHAHAYGRDRMQSTKCKHPTFSSLLNNVAPGGANEWICLSYASCQTRLDCHMYLVRLDWIGLSYVSRQTRLDWTVICISSD
eukprot:890768-Amorphochlora_amoeboformis.AAC.1